MHFSSLITLNVLPHQIVKEYFEDQPDYAKTLNLLSGKEGRPKLFVDKPALSAVGFPKLLRGFQV